MTSAAFVGWGKYGLVEFGFMLVFAALCGAEAVVPLLLGVCGVLCIDRVGGGQVVVGCM